MLVFPLYFCGVCDKWFPSAIKARLCPCCGKPFDDTEDRLDDTGDRPDLTDDERAGGTDVGDGLMEAITDRPPREFCWMGNKHSNPGESRNWYTPGLPLSVPRPGDRIRIMLGSEIPDSLARLVDMETA